MGCMVLLCALAILLGAGQGRAAGGNARPRASRHKMSVAMPAIVVGLSKTGTTSIFEFGRCGGLKAGHHNCLGRDACGKCIRDNVLRSAPPLDRCGGFELWAQLDFTAHNPKHCYWPQIDALDKIGDQYPSATWILNTRSPERWLKSFTSWGGIRNRLAKCKVSTLPSHGNLTDAVLLRWAAEHPGFVKGVAARHPRVKLVEVDIESPDAGEVLGKALGVPATCWGHANDSKRVAEEKARKKALSKMRKKALASRVEAEEKKRGLKRVYLRTQQRWAWVKLDGRGRGFRSRQAIEARAGDGGVKVVRVTRQGGSAQAAQGRGLAPG